MEEVLQKDVILDLTCIFSLNVFTGHLTLGHTLGVYYNM